MKNVYIDSEHKCHTENDGTMTAVETSFFDGKCDEFIHGHCCEVKVDTTSIYAWKPYDELDAAQREYERQQIAEYEANLAELDALVLNFQYNNLIGEL